MMTQRDPRWRLVLAHDARGDGQFVYAVKTTGVHCRPSCAARRPKPENISFHSDGAAARAAGFRPCRRCRPDEPRELAAGTRAFRAATGRGDGRVDSAEARSRPRHGVAYQVPFRRRRKMLACSPTRPIPERPGGADQREAAGAKPPARAGCAWLTPKAWRVAERDERARQQLRQGPSVTDALYAAGFNSSGRFYAAVNRALGMTPSRFRRGGEGERIAFASGRSALGRVLAAEGGRGVCAILLGNGAAALEAELHRLFPRADIQPGGAAMRRRLRQVIALVETPAAGHVLPLDLRGTAFERRIWRALRRLPAGSRVSYGELARRLGLPNAARAVARACAANRLAVAVPCHRVISADGAMAGYRWGVGRKRALLQREARA